MFLCTVYNFVATPRGASASPFGEDVVLKCWDIYTSNIMGAYHSTADFFEDYATTDSGERPKKFDYYNGTRLCMIPVGLYPHYRRGGSGVATNRNASDASE